MRSLAKGMTVCFTSLGGIACTDASPSTPASTCKRGAVGGELCSVSSYINSIYLNTLYWERGWGLNGWKAKRAPAPALPSAPASLYQK